MFQNYIRKTKTPSPPSSGLRIGKMAAATLSLTFGALSVMAAAAPAAEAAQAGSAGPCTVTAGKPYHQGFSPSGKKMIKYPIHVKCTRHGVKVILQQRMMEDDGDHWWNRNDVQKGWHTPAGTPLTFSKAGEKDVNPIPEYRLTKTRDDAGTPEEVYHQVRFRVWSNGVTSKDVTVASPVTKIRP